MVGFREEEAEERDFFEVSDDFGDFLLIGWIVPISLLAYITDTKTVSDLSNSFICFGSIIPFSSTGA